MRVPPFRLPTLTIAVAIAALGLAGLTRGSPSIVSLSLTVAGFAPFLALLAYLARQVGMFTLFR